MCDIKAQIYWGSSGRHAAEQSRRDAILMRRPVRGPRALHVLARIADDNRPGDVHRVPGTIGAHPVGSGKRAQTSELYWVEGALAYAPDSELCAVCVPTQPNGAERRQSRCNTDREKLLAKRDSTALTASGHNSAENRLASLVNR